VRLTEFLAQLVGAPLGAVYTAKLHAVSAIAIEMGRVVDGDEVGDAWQYLALCKRADLLHGFFNIFSGPRGAWPDEHRLPSEAAEAVRLACERDVFAKLPLLYTLAWAALVRTKMHPERLDELIESARHEALAGLDALVQEAAAEPKADMLQALHVACGAAAVESLRGPIVGVIDGVPVWALDFKRVRP
jgi:hypothetical protein